MLPPVFNSPRPLVPSHLEKPSLDRGDSYRSLVAEFADRGEPFIPFPLSFPTDDLPALIELFEGFGRGIGIPPHFVPHETYWLIAGGEVVAVSNLRLRLSASLRLEGGHIGYGVRPSARRRGHATAILAATLQVAAARHGMSRCLVTCAKSNLGSAGAIRNNGGVLDSEGYSELHAGTIQRYWVPTRAAAPAA